MNSYDIQSMNIDEVNSILKEYGEKSFRAKQIFQWLHEKQSKSYDMMTNIPVGLKERLQTDYPLTQLKDCLLYTSPSPRD